MNQNWQPEVDFYSKNPLYPHTNSRSVIMIKLHVLQLPYFTKTKKEKPCS
jgi:hypothetical protein